MVLSLGLWALGCLPDNPPGEDDTTAGTGDETGDDEGGGGEILGCPHGPCTMLLVAQTLDDRIEVFVPDHPDAAYRGTIDLDLKPNECMGCGPGDNSDGRLDEPFGLVRAGGFLHVLVGHYPTPELGSLVAFPLSFFEGRTAGSTVAASEFFASGQFVDPVLGRNLERPEPIFIHRHASGRLLVGVFNNDLFASEETWVQTGRLLVVDADDPGGEIGDVALDTLGGGVCQGASQVVTLSDDVLGVACDGNETVAVLDASALGTGTPAEAAQSLGNGALCSIPGAMPGRRVRYLAPDGEGGFLVSEGPTPLDLLGGAQLWHMGADCGLLGNLDLPAEGDWQLGEVVRLPASTPTWLLASGSASADGLRGIFVVHRSGAALELCPSPIAGFDSHWDDGNGGQIEPFALAVTSDGTGLAVGAAPFVADPAGVGYGKVLWATLSGSDPCSLSASVIDLTDGQPGRAPAANAADITTFRRGPNVVVLQELGGG